MSVHHTVTVQLADRSYPIFIGDDLFSSAARNLTPCIASQRIVIITEENIAQRHLASFEREFLLVKGLIVK